jgi:glycosyltransferase involved in cell wall biosynthesis
VGVKVPARWLLRNRFVYQHALAEIAEADMVIVEQANKHLINPLLMLMSKTGSKKVAFWGLGENKQSNRSTISEWVKRQTMGNVDWFFAYTRGTAHLLEKGGVDASRITAVQNSVDTGWLSAAVARISDEDARECRGALGIPQLAPTALYCGSLERVKIGFLFESAEQVKREIRDFHLVIVGDGCEARRVREFSAERDWVHWVGPKYGEDKAVYFRIADIFCMPGRVGLAVLDAFAAALPLCTTALPNHGPEIEYLVPGENGIMTAPEPRTFAFGVVELLQSPWRLEQLKAGASDSGRQYSIDNMAKNFARGIVSCLHTC